MFGYNRKTDFILIASGHYANIMLALAYASRLCDYDVNVQCVCVCFRSSDLELYNLEVNSSEPVRIFRTSELFSALHYSGDELKEVCMCVCVLFTLIFLHILLTKL